LRKHSGTTTEPLSSTCVGWLLAAIDAPRAALGIYNTPCIPSTPREFARKIAELVPDATFEFVSGILTAAADPAVSHTIRDLGIGPAQTLDEGIATIVIIAKRGAGRIT